MQYLRAEICQRAGVNPFESARTVLEGLPAEDDLNDSTSPPDLLRLCHDVPAEVLNIGALYGVVRGKAAEKSEEEKQREVEVRKNRQAFRRWLRCYKRWDLGMVSTTDGKKRTLWHEKRWAQETTLEGPRKGRFRKAQKEAEEEKEEEADDGNAEDAATSEAITSAASARKATKGKGRKGEAELPAAEEPAGATARSRGRKRKAADEAAAAEERSATSLPRPRKAARRRAKAATPWAEEVPASSAPVGSTPTTRTARRRRRDSKNNSASSASEVVTAAAADDDVVELVGFETRRRSSRLRG